MSAVDEIMQHIPLAQLASQLGVDEQTAGAAAQHAIPALLGGLNANAQDPAGAASLEGALGNHSAGLIDGGVDLGGVQDAPWPAGYRRGMVDTLQEGRVDGGVRYSNGRSLAKEST